MPRIRRGNARPPYFRMRRLEGEGASRDDLYSGIHDFIRVALVLPHAMVQFIALAVRQGQLIRLQALPKRIEQVKFFRCRQVADFILDIADRRRFLTFIVSERVGRAC